MRPGFRGGLWVGLANAALETVTAGHTPWTLKNHADHSALQRLEAAPPPDRGWVDRDIQPRDRLSAVFYAGNVHDEAQPVHLKVADTNICATRCVVEYGNPCQFFCPASVYEMVDDGAGGKRCRSTPPTACIARHATSRTPTRSSTGRRPKAVRA